jgi:hypothetical protein
MSPETIPSGFASRSCERDFERTCGNPVDAIGFDRIILVPRGLVPRGQEKSELGRMQHLDAGIPGEVAIVEGEDVGDAIHGHRCHEPCIVGLFARYAVPHDESAPLQVDIIGVRQSKNRAFDASNNPVCLGGSEPESVILDGPRTNSPQLDEVLRGNTDAISFIAEPRYRVTGQAVLSVGAM